MSNEHLVVIYNGTEKFSGKKIPELMQCSDVIAQDFLWQFCTVLSMASGKYTGELFETAVCNSKQHRNVPLPFPGSFQLTLLFHNDWTNIHNNLGGFNKVLVGSRSPRQTGVWLHMWLMCNLTKGYSTSTF